MNDKGDFYIGNTKISSDSGEQVTFDIPVPTVTGEDPSTLSVVFDEVIIKERLLVEGGSNNTILSQFDGPVTFNGPVRFNNKLVITDEFNVFGKVKFTAQDDITNLSNCSGPLTGALAITGGVSIGKKLQVRDKVKICSTAADALSITGGVGIGGKLAVTGESTFTGLINANGGIKVPDNAKITLGNSDDLELVHDSGNSVIREVGTGDLYLQSNGTVYITKTSGSTSDVMASFAADSASSLHYGGSRRLTTTSDGVTIGLLGESDGNLVCLGDITAFASSDERMKDDIVPIPNALDKVLSISGNTFTWNKESNKEGQEDTGIIAQEIEKLGLPGVTTVRETGTHAVNYEKLVPLLIESIKELSGKVDNLEKDLKDHECCNSCHCCNDNNNPK